MLIGSALSTTPHVPVWWFLLGALEKLTTLGDSLVTPNRERTGGAVTGDVQARASLSGGTSAPAIYRMVARALEGRHAGGGALLDVGCGAGNLWPYVQSRFTNYIGADAVRYPGLPPEARFVQADFDRGIPLPNGVADVVVAVETIEHLDNPRAFMRDLVRLARAGGWVVASTPSQLSLLSLLTLIVKQRFSAFQDVQYPAHRTALLEVDLAPDR